jgi:hypothetical protein
VRASTFSTDVAILLLPLRWLPLSTSRGKIWLLGKLRKWAMSSIERYFVIVIFSWCYLTHYDFPTYIFDQLSDYQLLRTDSAPWGFFALNFFASEGQTRVTQVLLMNAVVSTRHPSLWWRQNRLYPFSELCV